jgi:hypothetical protein
MLGSIFGRQMTPPLSGADADSFLEAGDVDGCAVRKGVLKAVKEIQREEPLRARR